MQFKPPKIQDPDFGELIFMFISNAPKRSYWEGEWLFPPANTKIGITLDGDEYGPNQDARKWYLDYIPSRYDEMKKMISPILKIALRKWTNENIEGDVYRYVKLVGIGVENSKVDPTKWDISFETTGKKWLFISIPFIGNDPQEAEIDT
jgi:hypothetical protein